MKKIDPMPVYVACPRMNGVIDIYTPEGYWVGWYNTAKQWNWCLAYHRQIALAEPRN